MFKKKHGYNRYITPPTKSHNSIRILFLLLLGAVIVIALLVGLWKILDEPSSSVFFEESSSLSSHTSDELPDALDRQQRFVQTPPSPQIKRLESRVCKGDTLSGILEGYLSPVEILQLGKACKPVFSLSNIRPGHPYSLTLEGKKLTDFEYEMDDRSKLVVRLDGKGFHAAKKEIVYNIKREVVQGSIASNLSQALDDLGQGPGLAVMMEDILGWDVDFGKDIREGDGFRILLEKRFRKGKPAGYGHILAIDFHNRGRNIKAFRFTDSKGRTSYFDEAGDSMRKAFLKAPLSFTRISSGYTNRRFHPILKRWKPHHGVDYAAPRGTPIRSIGDGVVVARAYDKAAGRYVKIRHARGYETVYNHMSRYGRSIRKGVQVKQGQVIGYVGATGYATGPHLDFRIKRYGKYVNPLRMKSPPTNPVPAKDMKRFQHESSLMAREMGVPLAKKHNG